MTWESNQIAKYEGCLMHYGVPNMRWGIRRYQNKDGSLTPEGKIHYGVGQGGNEKLKRKYEHEMKKMQKLAGNTDVEGQRAAAMKYGKRAVASAVVGDIASGFHISKVVRTKKYNKELDEQISALKKTAERDENDNFKWYNKKIDDLNRDIKDNTNALSSWDVQSNPEWRKNIENQIAQSRNDVKKYERQALQAQRQLHDKTDADVAKLESLRKSEKMDTKSKVAVGVAAAAYGTSAYNLVKSIKAASHTTEKGHEKAVAKATAQYARMQKTFKNTPYMSLFKEEIAAYKKEHPNTQLTDKEILKNLM